MQVSAASNSTLWLIYNRIADLAKGHRPAIDVSLRWLRGSVFLGHGVDVDLGDPCSDSEDDDPSPINEDVEEEHDDVDAPAAPLSDMPAALIPREPSVMSRHISTQSRARGTPTRFVMVTGPLISSRFCRMLAKLSKNYSGFMRPRLFCLHQGREVDSTVYMQVFGASEREREHFVAIIQTAVESFSTTGINIRAVNMSLLPGKPLAPPPLSSERCFGTSVTVAEGVALPDPADVPTEVSITDDSAFGVFGYSRDAVSEDTDVSGLSSVHSLRVGLDVVVLEVC